MENEPQSAPQREIVVDSDWISGLAMTLLLVIALAFALQDWKLLAHGIVAQPVTLYTVLGAGYLFYVAIGVSGAPGLFVVLAGPEVLLLNRHYTH